MCKKFFFPFVVFGGDDPNTEDLYLVLSLAALYCVSTIALLSGVV